MSSFGRLTCRVEQGDALAQRGVAALVIPANRQLTLDWGSHVAEAVRKQAGPEPEREALAQFPEGVSLEWPAPSRDGAKVAFTRRGPEGYGIALLSVADQTMSAWTKGGISSLVLACGSRMGRRS